MDHHLKLVNYGSIKQKINFFIQDLKTKILSPSDSSKVILTNISVHDIELVSVLVEELFILWPEVDFFFQRCQNVTVSDLLILVEVPKTSESANEDTHEE